MKSQSRHVWGQGLESQVKLNVAGDRKGKKNVFCLFISSRMSIKGHVGLLLNVSEGMVTKDMGRAGILNIIFVFGNPHP